MDKKKGKLKWAMAQRTMGVLLAAVMVFNTLPVSGFAVSASEKQETGLCRHHRSHTAECAYTEMQPCTHEHSDEYYEIVTECVHIHTDECYPETEKTGEGSAAPSDAGSREPENCSHQCSEESGCISRTPDCHHEHDESCGYVPAEPCAYVCAICEIQALIDALPDAEAIAEDNADEVQEQLEVIAGMISELDDEQLEQLDLGRYEAAAEILFGMSAGVRPAAENSGEINMDWVSYGFVFAQGVPIVIKQNGGITSIYGTDGVLLSGDEDVSSCAIYGGWFQNEHSGDTSITMKSGTVYSIYGGCNSGILNGDTTIVVKSGTMQEIWGGGYEETLNGNTNIVVEGGEITGAIFGGGYNDSINGTTNVTFEGNAVTGFIYGGGFGGYAENTQVKIKGGQITNSVFGGGNGSYYGGGDVNGTANVTFEGNAAAGVIYGGGEQCYVENARIELKSGTCLHVYGGNNGGTSRYDTTQNAVIILGVDWGSLAQIYAGGCDSPTASSEIIIQNYKPKSGQNCSLHIDAGTATDSTVVVRRNDGGPLGAANTSNLDLVPIDVKNIVAEYGQVTLLEHSGRYTDLKLDSLEIQADAHVKFGTWDSIEIGELRGGGGQFLLPAHFVSGTRDIVNIPVTLGKIFLSTPLILKAEGTGWLEEDLEKLAFFQGSGVDSLDSADCFFAEGYDVVLRDLQDGSGKGIYLQFKKAEEPVYISRLEFNENPVTYNGTISLTVGVGKQLATADRLELIPDARIQIRGSNNQDVMFADIQVNGDGTKATIIGTDGIMREAQVNGGYITFDLPVNASLLDTCKEGLRMIATAPDQYSSTVQLTGPDGETEIEIIPSPITLTKTIPEPVFRDPVESELEDGAFYTASVLWHLDNDDTDNAFRLDCDYCADIILTAKEGHWLCKESIGNTVIYDGKETTCVFNPDGTATLKNLKSTRFDGCVVSVTTSPEEGGIVTGGGIYSPGSTVTVKAEPAAGWRFAHWTEDGQVIADTAEFSFTTFRHRSITAVFNKKMKKAVEPQAGSSVSVKGSNILTYGQTLSDLILDSVIFVEQGTNTEVKGTLAWKAPSDVPAAATETAEWVFTPEDGDEYAELTGMAAITVVKATPEVEAPAADAVTYHPSRTLGSVGLTGGSAAWTVGGSTVAVKGTWCWKDGSVSPAVGDSGYCAVFTPEDTENYNTVERDVAVTVGKAKPYIEGKVSASQITYGDSLSKSVLTGTAQYSESDSTPVPGSFTWKDGTIKPAVSDSGSTRYTVIFTSDEGTNYSSAESSVTLTVEKAENVPNMPSDAMNVSRCCEKVSDVKLPSGWQWQEGDKDNALEIDVPQTATAVYVGTDKDNYKNTEVTVTITRLNCDHEKTELRNVVDATCEKEGYSGDAYCIACGAKVESGKVIPASGHDWQENVIKQPTTSEEGLRRCTCKNCGASREEAIPKLPPISHTHSYSETEARAATCTEAGIKVYSCSCGDSYTEGTPALGHSYYSQMIKAPTVSEEGVMAYTCTRCGHSYTAAISRLEAPAPTPGQAPGMGTGDTVKPGTGSTEKPGTGTGTAKETRPEPGIPFIKNKDGKIGWDMIRAEEEQAREGSVINVDMNGTTVVPGDIFDSIKGRDITITFDMGGGIIWSVDGKGITADKTGDIDFSVKTGVSAIPVDIVNNVTGENYSIQISLSYEGEFGLTAVLSINLGRENAGNTASLYYYNESTGELEFICADEVAEDGKVSLAFTHASDYVIAINGDEEEESGGDVPESSKTMQEKKNALWLIVAGIIALAGIAFAAVFAWKKKEENESDNGRFSA